MGTVINVDRKVATSPAGCVDTALTIEVSGIEIPICFVEVDCTAGDGSSSYDDIAINGSKFLDVFDVTARCGDGSTPPGCYTFLFDDNVFHRKGYISADCSGTPAHEADYGIAWVIANVDSTWYIVGQGFQTGFELFFYASAADLSSPIANQLTSFSAACRDDALPSSNFLDYWFGDCTPGSGDFLWTFLGINGSVTVS